jgi:hypothetical protein
MVSTTFPDGLAERILRQALDEHRAAELLVCLFDGGSCTVDARSGRLVLVSGDHTRHGDHRGFARDGAPWLRPEPDRCECGAVVPEWPAGWLFTDDGRSFCPLHKGDRRFRGDPDLFNGDVQARPE